MVFERHLRGRTVPHAAHRVHVFRRQRPGQQHVRAVDVRHRVQPKRAVRDSLRAGYTGAVPVPDSVEAPRPRAVRYGTPGGRCGQVNVAVTCAVCERRRVGLGPSDGGVHWRDLYFLCSTLSLLLLLLL